MITILQKRLKKSFFITFFYFPLLFSFSGNAQIVTTLAGDGNIGHADGTGTAASFNSLSGLTVAVDGTIYVADEINNMIRKVTPAGVVTTWAGSTIDGSADGTGTAAQFKRPSGIAVASDGTVYVLDTFNQKIRKISPAGVVTTLAGGTWGSADGTGTAAQFSYPLGIAVAPDGMVYVADTNNMKIRKITPAGVVTTLAGGTYGSADGTGTVAQFNQPMGLAIASDGTLYVADTFNNTIRKITSAGVVTTLAGTTTLGYADGTGTAAEFNHPYDLTIASDGTLYVADRDNLRIRKVTQMGAVTTYAGSGTIGELDGTASTAQFYYPSSIAAAPDGTVYVGEGFLIRKIVSTPMGVDEFDAQSFKYYPTVVSDVLSISYSKELLSIKIFDMIGKEIYFKNINNKDTEIDMSTYTAGVYLIKVALENGTKTFKVIKK